MNSSNQNPRNLVEIKLKFGQPNTKPKAQSMNELREQFPNTLIYESEKILNSNKLHALWKTIVTRNFAKYMF